jgi:hypothetical protein
MATSQKTEVGADTLASLEESVRAEALRLLLFALALSIR